MKSIGSDHFLYDKVGRLTESTAAQFAPGITKQYAYDPFGNLVTTTTKQSGHADEVFSTPVSGKTNHLSGASYDAAGNQLGWITRSMKYDAFGQVVQLLDTYVNQAYIYTAEGERLATYDAMTNRTSWKIRDLGGRVLREFLNAPVNGVANWSWKEDWIWRGSVLLGAATPQGNRHFDVDHLGSVRLITDDAKNVLSRHQYWAYGEEASSGSQDAEVMKFAGQERDFGTYYPDGIDYMHARYYDNRLSRFTTMDPLGGSPGAPQSWNRYGYVLGSPVTLVDPYGWAPASGSSGGSSNGNPEDCREDGHGNVICGGEITVTANNPFYRGTFFWDRGWEHSIFSSTLRWYVGRHVKGLAEHHRQEQLYAENWVDAQGRDAVTACNAGVQEACAHVQVLGGALVISFGHGAPHLAGTELEGEAAMVETAIENRIRAELAGGGVATGYFRGRMEILGRVVEYRAYTLANGAIHVGTYFMPFLP